MRHVVSIVGALAIAASASSVTAQQPAGDPPAETTAPTPTILHADEGEKLLMFGDRYVIRNVRLTLGDRVVEVEPGTTMFVPPGTWHGVEAHGDAEATMLFIFPETDIAEFFRAVGYREGESPPELTPEDWGRIMEQHQMHSRD